MEDLNNVCVKWNINAEPPIAITNFNSGAISDFPVYFSANSSKISSKSLILSLTDYDQPSNFISKGSNLLFKNSAPVTAAIKIFL